MQGYEYAMRSLVPRPVPSTLAAAAAHLPGAVSPRLFWAVDLELFCRVKKKKEGIFDLVQNSQMCRFQLPTQGTISELTDRVRPASSAPARPSGVRMRRAPAFRDDREANATGTDTAPMLSDGPGASPVLWTSRQRRPDSASNPATWPRRKLEGVLEAAGVSHQHCNDHSSLVEMVVMCLRDYYAVGAQYDRGRIRDLQASEVAGHQFRKPDTSADAERAHDDSGDLRDTSCACVLDALPCSHREPASRAGDVFHVCDRPTTSGHPNYLSSQRVGGAAGDRQGGESRCRKDEEARQRLGPLGGRGSRRELAAMAKGGRLEELSRSISMAGAAQATRTRCANIWRERLRDRDEELLHHTLYERERRRPRGRQRDTALEILEACVEADGRYYPSPPPPPPRVEGMPARPNVVTNGASSSFVVRRVGGSTSRNFQLVHGDFGWEQVEDPLQSSTDGTAGRAVNSGGLAHACSAGVWERESREGGGCGPGVSRRIVHCHVDARRDELGAVAAGLQDEGGRSRASMVLKVAAGKDRTLFE